VKKDLRGLYASTVLRSSRALAFGVAALAAPAHANPVGGTVSAGSAAIQGQGTPVVQVNQTSDRAVIDWKSFNIAPGEVTRFNQPSAASAILNRIHDQNPSQILGNLSANGQVMLVNPNGMLFGKDSRIDVSGLVATSASISSQSFMNATPFRFGQPGLPDSAVINQGTITVDHAGLAALVAPEVRNEGMIKAKTGKVVLGSGDTMTLDLYGDQLVSIAASGKLKAQRIDQAGRIEAAGGEVILTTADAAKVIDRVINMDGWVDVNGLTEEAGSIVLHAGGGDANVNGEMHANGTQGWGGRLQITGENIRVGAGALLTASGTTGGGQILIGGDYMGGGTTPHAKTTVIEQGAEIRANAVDQGNGGRVIAWSDDRTTFDGLIQVKGGLLGGDGGFAETSSKEILSAHGLADASTPKGTGGLWLLDPRNITISNGATSNIAGNPDWVSTGNSAVLNNASVEAALNAGTSVTVTTGATGAQAGNITVSNTISKTAGGNASLTLTAHNNIAVNATISSNSNKLNVTLRADSDNSGAGDIKVTNAAINTNGGNVIIGGGADASTDEAVGTSNYGVELNNGDISSGVGNISIRGRGEAAGNNNYGIYVHNGSVLQSTSGDITLTGFGGNGVFENSGVEIADATTQITSADGDISITGTGGSNGSDNSNYGVHIRHYRG
jgi:filamentous hemagglutinin family protein